MIFYIIISHFDDDDISKQKKFFGLEHSGLGQMTKDNMKCQKLLSTGTVSFRAKWWGMVAIEVAPDGKFDINPVFAKNISVVVTEFSLSIEFRAFSK